MLAGIVARWLQWFVGSAPIIASTTSWSPSWHHYVRAPNSRIVYPVAINPSHTLGNVSNPEGLLTPGEGGVTTFTRPATTEWPHWPSGTTANASSYHMPNTYNGQPRTYHPSNAIDGEVSTFWNDDTPGVYPDILTLILPGPTSLSGITILSCDEGVPMDLKVEVLQANGLWTTAGMVTNNEAVWIQVHFVTTIQAYGVSITVTRDQVSTSGEFTRINEVWPGLVKEPQRPPSVVVDFGKPVVGFLSISFAGASSNRPGMRLAFSEFLEYLTDVSDFSRSYNGDTITPGSDQVAVLPQSYIWNDTHGCTNGSRVCADGLHGFRYVKIYLDALEADFPAAEPYGSVSIDAVYLNFTAYLGMPDTFTGWFECSDSILNRFWFDAAYTNEMCIDTFGVNDTEPRNAASASLIGKLVLHDGPKRDRDPYVGDLAVSARTLYLTHNASIAAQNVLADLADHQRNDGWIPPASINNYELALFDYPLWWVVTSCDLLLYTESESYMLEYYSAIVKVLDEFYPSVTDKTTGLVSKDLGGMVGYGDYAFLPRTGIVTYYNALYVLALQNAANIASFYNHSADAKRWTQRAQQVSLAVNGFLWDPAAGAYFDSLQGITHGQDGNMLAILANIANNTRTTALLSYWSTLALPYGNPFYSNDALGAGFSTRVYPFISYFEISARFASGLGDSALEEIRRLYGWMEAHDPGTTFWEGIGAEGGKYEGGYTSAAHGWSTGVVPALTNYILGVIPTAPGFRHWTLKPVVVEGVSWAKGQVPTPKGPFAVDWTIHGSKTQFQMSVDVPEGTRGEVAVPMRGVAAVFVDGLVIWKGGRGLLRNARYGDGYVTFELSGGKHTVAVSREASLDLVINEPARSNFKGLSKSKK